MTTATDKTTSELRPMLVEIMHDMSVLYKEIRNKETDLRTAAELSNASGKSLKAYQLLLANEIFVGQLGKRITDPAQLLTTQA